jgi:hypothetical protein
MQPEALGTVKCGAVDAVLDPLQIDHGALRADARDEPVVDYHGRPAYVRDQINVGQRIVYHGLRTAEAGNHDALRIGSRRGYRKQGRES